MAGVGGNWALMQSSLKRKRTEESAPSKSVKRRRRDVTGDEQPAKKSRKGKKKEKEKEQKKEKEKKEKKKKKKQEGSHLTNQALGKESWQGKKLTQRGKDEEKTRSGEHLTSKTKANASHSDRSLVETACQARVRKPTAAMRERNVRPAPFVLKAHSGLPRSERVVRPGEEFYEELLTGPYQGFVVEEPPASGSEEAEWTLRAEEAFGQLSDEGYFKYDVVQPGKVEDQAATYVRRCVVGDAGATYKYLGLRVFAYPWDGDGLPDAIKEVARLNKRMIEMTNRQLDSYHGDCRVEDRGSCQYNLTLINEMPPITAPDGKEAPFPGSGRAVVSWHQDTSLEDYSSVAVFHVVQSRQSGVPWSVAVRVIYDKKTAALQVPLPTGTTYYMLDTFNRHHQHVVIAGDGLRYSSTHRVAKTNNATWQYIISIAIDAVGMVRSLSSLHDMSTKQIGTVQAAHTEIEEEWLQQWYWQGRAHASRQLYWKERIEGELLGLWRELESHCKDLAEALISTGHSACSGALATALQKRLDSRALWERKLAIFKASAISAKLPREDQPAPSPLFPFDGRSLGKDLGTAVKQLQRK